MNKLKNPMVSIVSLSFVFIAAFILSPALTRIEAVYGFTAQQAHLLITLPMLTSIPFSLLCARLTLYLSKKKLGLIAFAIILVFGILPYFQTGYGAVVVSRALMGVGIGFVNSISPSLAADFYEPGRKRDTAMGIQGASTGLGGIVLSALGGWLCTFGARVTFLGYLICIPLGLIFLLAAEDRGRVKPAEAEEHVGQFDVRVLKYAVAAFLFNCCFSVLMISISYKIVDSGIGSTVDAGYVSSINSLGNMMLGLAFGFVAGFFKRWSRPVGAVTAAAGMILIALAQTVGVALAASFVVGLGMGLFVTSCIADISSEVRHSAVTLSLSIFMSMICLAQFLSPIIFDMIMPVFGDTAVNRFLAAGGGMALIGLYIGVANLFTAKKPSEA